MRLFIFKVILFSLSPSDSYIIYLLFKQNSFLFSQRLLVKKLIQTNIIFLFQKKTTLEISEFELLYMSTSGAFFNPRIRTAGDLSSDLVRVGSGRSELKLRMRSNSIVSKHDDIFANNSNNELIIEPLRDLHTPPKVTEKKEMPPLPPQPTAVKEKRKKKHRVEERTGEELTDEQKQEIRERRERRKNRSSSATLKKSESTKEVGERSHKQNGNSFLNSAYEENNNEEDDYMESLKRITSKHRIRRGSNSGGAELDTNIDKENNEKPPPQQKTRSKKGSSTTSAKSAASAAATPTPRTLIGTKPIEDNTSQNGSTTNEFLGSSTANLRGKRNSVVKMNAFEIPAETPRSQVNTARAAYESEVDNENISDDVPVDFENKEMTRVLNLIDDAYFKPIFDRYLFILCCLLTKI